MANIVRYTLKQAVLLNVLFVILVVAGVFSLLTTPTENMPQVDFGKVFIHTVYFGASADDVEQLVTRKIEDAVESLENVDYVQSHSYRNYSSVQVKFVDDSDYEDLYDDLRFRVLNIKDELPDSADEPTFFWIDTSIVIPVVIAHLGGDLPLRSLASYADELRTLLLTIADVRDVSIAGAPEDEFHLSLNPEKLRRYGVTFMQVVQAIEKAGIKVPTGRFRTGDSALMLDAGRHFKNQQDVLEVVVRRDGDRSFVRVGDLVTSARLHYRDRITIPSVNGKRCVYLAVSKEEQGNSVTISEQVKAKARQFAQRHAAEGLELVFTNDSVIEINSSINILGGNLILGMTLVTLVLWVTLGFRNAMLTAIGIPFSFLCTLIIMKYSGVTINTISLFSFVLVTGIIVDDAVIIVENTFRHMQLGKTRRQAIVDGVSEVMLPIISSAMTTMLAFIPMLIMTGSTGEFFAIIPKTVTYALLASLFEALFILPIHIFDWGPKTVGATAEFPEDEEASLVHLQTGLFAPLWKVYRRLILWVLDHKGVALVGVNVVFISAVLILLLSMLGIAPLIKVKFFPGNYFRYHVTMQTSAGTSLERTNALIHDISRFIMSLGTQQAQSAAGYAGFYEDLEYIRHSGPNYGQVVVTLPDKSERKFPDNPANDPMQHLDYMRQQVSAYVARTYGDDPAQPVVQVFEEADGPPTGKDVNIRVQSTTMNSAIAASDILLKYMRSAPALAGLVDLQDDRPIQCRTVQFLPRQEAINEYNLSPVQVTAIVAGVLNGWYAGKYRDTDEEVDLVVRMARDDDPVGGAAGLRDPMDALDVPVIDHSAASLYLRDLVTAQYVLEPNMRARYQGKPAITISADIQPGANLSSALVQKKVAAFYEASADQLPGTTIAFGGEFESTGKSFASLGLAFCIAIMGIYMVLATQFRDYWHPLLILTAVPFAIIGVTYGILFSRTIFTIGSFIATVGLSGVAVNNTILLIDFMNKRIRAGKPLRQAILESCAARMRPVLITTVTTVLGLLPMAIGIPSKSISWAPMATAFVTGLCSSTILALLITPANYEILGQIRSRMRQRKFKALRRQNGIRHKS